MADTFDHVDDEALTNAAGLDWNLIADRIYAVGGVNLEIHNITTTGTFSEESTTDLFAETAMVGDRLHDVAFFPSSVMITVLYSDDNAGEMRLAVIDVSTPASPAFQGEVILTNPSDNYNSFAMVVEPDDNRQVAFVLTENTIESVDISDPNNPVHKDSVDASNDLFSSTKGENRAELGVDEDRQIVIFGVEDPFSNDTFCVTYDVSDIANITNKDKLKVYEPGRDGAFVYDPVGEDVFVSVGDNTSSDTFLFIVDASDAAALSLRSSTTFSTAETVQDGGGGMMAPSRVGFVQDNVGGEAVLLTYDVSNLNSPTQLQKTTIGASGQANSTRFALRTNRDLEVAISAAHANGLDSWGTPAENTSLVVACDGIDVTFTIRDDTQDISN